MGKISKQWSGLLREAFTDADYFGITFPMDLDVKMKAVMIGACFLIVSTLQKYKFCEKCWIIVISFSVMLGNSAYDPSYHLFSCTSWYLFWHDVAVKKFLKR